MDGRAFLHKFSYNSPVILTFSFISLGAMLLGKLTHDASTWLLFSVYRSSLLDPLFYVRLFCHVFGHVDFGHFVSNFVIILLVGPMLEEKYGQKNMIVMMVATAFVTGTMNVLFFQSALLGASGIAFMLIILSSYANSKSDKIPLTLVLVFLVYVGQEVLQGIYLADNISHFTHIVGGICGVVFGLFFQRRGFIKSEANNKKQ